MLFGLKLDHVSPWDGAAIPVARALPKMERVDPYNGAPIQLAPSRPLELETTTDPWDGEIPP